MAKHLLRLTNANVKKVVPPETGRVEYHDTKLDGFMLRVSGAGTKTFCVRTDLDGKTKRVSLGRFPALSAEQAERKAMEALSTLANGVDPNALRRAERARLVTLRQCLGDYAESRSNLKEGTAKAYRQALEQYVPDWLDKPLKSVTRDKVERRHKEIGEKSPTRANVVMRVLRALFEYAHGKYEDEHGEPIILHNPVKRLSHSKAWFKETRRDTYIKPAALAPWYEAVTTAPEWLRSRTPETIRDYLLVVLFTGLRRREAAAIRWDWIDLQHRVLTIPSTVTKNGHAHALPLPDFLYELMERRRDNGSDYLFPGAKAGICLQEPKKAIAKIRERSGVPFTLHDLRRTFITSAEALGIRDYTLKRLLNHRSGGDVTDGYIVTDVERLREPMQMIADRLLGLAEGRSNVVLLPVRAVAGAA